MLPRALEASRASTTWTSPSSARARRPSREQRWLGRVSARRLLCAWLLTVGRPEPDPPTQPPSAHPPPRPCRKEVGHELEEAPSVIT